VKTASEVSKFRGFDSSEILILQSEDSTEGTIQEKRPEGPGVSGVISIHEPGYKEVITLLPSPVIETATKRDKPGDQQTESQSLSAAEVRIVHVKLKIDLVGIT